MHNFDDINELTGEVIGAAIEVHKALGPGLLESVYEECMCVELGLREETAVKEAKRCLRCDLRVTSEDATVEGANHG